VKTVGVLLAVALAVALQTTLTRYVVRGSVFIDLVLVAVVYVALTWGPGAGLMAGTIAGLVEDALSAGGVVGIGGLAKTVVGFFSGVIGTQFIVTNSLPRFVVFFAATVVHEALFIGMYVLLDMRRFDAPYAVVAKQALGNAVVGVITFQIVELLPGVVERRRAQRGRLRR
jgi:rod shape-determining protein MreD